MTNCHTIPPYRFSVYCLLAAVNLCSFTANGQIKRQPANEYSLSDSKRNSVIVAQVGPIAITAQEFLMSYEFGPAFPKRTKDSKQRYLNFMIYEKLLALEGYADSALTRGDVRRSLDEIEGDLATEELYKKDVLKGINISSKEIDEGVRKESIELSVQWIFSGSKESIFRQKDSIDSGISFDSLYHRQFNDSVNTDDRSMEISQFKLEDRNPVLARLIDSLGIGKVSLPMHVDGGWYLFRYTGNQKSRITTQSEEMKLREDVQRVIMKRRSDSLSDRYVQKMMAEHTPVILRESINLLEAYLAKGILSPEKYSSWHLNELIGVKEAVSVVDSLNDEAYSGKQLVRLFHGSYTILDFLQWYAAREMNLKFRLTDPQEFFASLEGYVWRMVRDKLLCARAKEKGFHRLETVKTQKKWWEEKLMYQAEKMKIQNSIPVNDTLLLRYYSEHVSQYKEEKGNTIDFNKAKDDVRRDYYSTEVMKRTVHDVLKLKQKYTVTIRNDVLNKLYVDTENNPRAIDVYAVKSGGTFPRPAFPSIDYEWQEWN